MGKNFGDDKTTGQSRGRVRRGKAHGKNAKSREKIGRGHPK